MTRHPPRVIPRAAAPLDAAAGRRALPPAPPRTRAVPFVPAPLSRRLWFETLEPRFLLSADVAPVLMSDVVVATPAAGGAEFRALAPDTVSPIVIGTVTAPTPRARELAVVDTAVPDHDRLADLLREAAAARDHDLDVVLVAPGRDGIAAVSAALEGRSGVAAVHVVAHGDPGGIRLGATRLDLAALAANADAVRAWGAALAPDADLLLYGCDTAAAHEGRALVDALAMLTGADVAASDDATGARSLGADWDLEYASGTIETPAGPARAAADAWQGILAATYWLGGDTTPPFSDLETAAPTDATWDADNNYDPARDAEPGRVIQKDNATPSQNNPDKHQTWTVAAPGGGLDINFERVTLSLWTAMKDNTAGKQGTVTAYLLDLASPTATSGTQIAQATVPLRPWSATFTEQTLDFGFVDYTVAAGRFLAVKVVVGNTSDDDLWFAYDATAYPSRLQIGVQNLAPAVTNAVFGVNENAAAGTAVGTVVASDPDPASSYNKVYWTDSFDNHIIRANLDGSGWEPLVTGLTNPVSIAVDSAGGKLYWTDDVLGTINRANLDGSNAQVIVSGLNAPSAIKVDAQGGRLYWANRGASTIERANLDGTGRAIILSAAQGVSVPEGIELDVAGGKVYWVDSGNDSIRRANLDGTGAQAIVTGLANPRAIALDVASGRVYWAEPGTLLTSGRIGRANLDGSGAVPALITTSDGIRGLTVDAVRGRVYWTEEDNNQIMSARLDGTGAAQFVSTGLPLLNPSAPAGITMGPAIPGLAFAIMGGNTGGAFAMDPVTGVLTVANPAALDFETTPSFTLTVRATDAGGYASTGTVIVNVANLNEAPTGANATVTTAEDTPYAFAVADFPFADADAGDALGGVRIDALPATGTLALSGVGVTAGQFVAAADITAGRLAYTPAPNASGSPFTTFTFTVRDAGTPPAFAAASRTLTVNVLAVNDAPVIGGLAGDAQTYAEGAALTVADVGANATVADPDSPDFAGGTLTVAIVAGGDPAEDVLAIRHQGTAAGQIGVFGADVRFGNVLIGTFAGGTGGADLVVTLNANATPAAVQALVRNVGYRNTDTAEPTPGARTIRFELTDGDGGTSAAVQTTVTVTPVNDAPSATIVPATYDVIENVPYTLSGTGISVADVDAANGVVRVTVSVAAGSLSAAAGSTGVTVSGGGTSVRLDGTIAQVNALLAGTGGGLLQYVMPSDSPPATDTLVVSVNDNGNTGSGGALAGSDSALIRITAVNDAPLNTMPGTALTTEDTPLVFAAGQIAVSDVDAGTGAVRVTLGVTNGTLTLSGTTGLAFTTGDGTADAAMVFTGTVATINAALSGLTFTPTPGASGTAVITLSTDDLGNTGTGGALVDANDTTTIVVQPVNDPPSAAGGSVKTPPNVAHAFSAGDFGFADPDVGDTLSAVRIDLPPTRGELRLAGVLVASGELVTAAQLAAGELTFSLSGAALPDPTFGYAVRDTAGAYSAAATMTIRIANTPPSGADGSVLTFEGMPLVLGASVFGFADGDAGDTLTAVRIDALPGAGALTLGGTAVSAGDVIARADLDAGLLVYTPPAAGTGTPLATFAFSVRDAYGPDFDPVPNVLAVDVLAPVGPPVIVAPVAVTATEDAPRAISGISVSDANGDLDTVSLAAANGTLTVSLAGGAAIGAGANASDALTLTGTQAQINAALATLVYRGNANFAGADTIVITAIDLLASSSSAGIGVSVSPVNDAPVAAIAPSVYAAIEGTALQLAGTGLSVGDIDSATATVTLSVVSGILTVTGGAGVSVAGSGSAVVVLSGAVADIDALLAGAGSVEYLMSADAPPPTDTLRLAIDDGAGGNAFDLAQIDVASVNDAPVNTLPGTVATLEDTPIVLTGAQIAVTDVDVGTAEVQVGLTATRGVLDLAGVAGLTFLAGDGIADASMSFRGTLTAVNAALNGLRYTPNLNYNGLAYLDIVTSDLGGSGAGGALEDRDRMAIDIAPVNDLPVGTGATVTATEDTPYVLGPSAFGFTDVDFGDALSAVRIDSTTLPAGATLRLSGVAVTTGQVISQTDLAAGRLVFQAAPDANGAGYASLAFSVRDTGVPAAFAFDATPRTLVFNVAAVNDAPVNTLPAAPLAVTPEDTALVLGGAARLAVSDVDVGAGTVEVALATPQGVLDLATIAGLTFLSGDGVGDASMRFRGTLGAVNAALDGLVFRPAADFNGTATLTLQSNDLGATGAGGARTDADTLSIVVTPVNDAPAGTDAVAAAVEDTAYVLSTADFGFTDIDAGDALSAVRIDALALPAGATLRLSGVAVTTGQVISATDIAAGRLAFVAAPDANGAGYASLAFSVRDAGGPAFDPSPNTLVFDVAAVNDAPVITSNGGGASATVTFPENGVAAVATVTANDVDSPASARTHAIAGGADAALFVIDASNGTLRLAAPPDFESPLDVGADNVYDVVVSADDGAGGVDTQALAIAVTGVDEAPTATGDTYTVVEDTTLTVSAAAGVLANDTDPEAGALSATLLVGPVSGTLTLAANGSFVYTPNANFVGTDSFRYRVTDGAGNTGAATVIIDVQPENRAPTSGDGAVSTMAGAAYVFTLADFAFSDQDGDALASVTVTTLPQVGALELGGAPVTAGQVIAAADIQAGLLRYVAPPDAPAAVASFGFVVSDGVASAAASTMVIGITAPPVSQTTGDGGAGTAAAPPPAAAEPAPATASRTTAARADAPAGEPPAGGGRASGSGGGADGGEAAQVKPAASESAAPAAVAAMGVAAPTSAGATGFSSSGAGALGMPGAPREATLGGVEVRDGSAHEQAAAEIAAKAARAIEAIAAPEFRQQLDRLREEQAEEAHVVTRVAGSVMVVTSGLSVGYVLWLLRGGVLLASLLTSLPAWRVIDPIAVLGRVGEDEEDDDSLQDMVSGKRADADGPEAEGAKEGGR